jgi:hypothetical protein
MKPGQRICSNDSRGLLDWYLVEIRDGIVSAAPTTATAAKKGDALVESFAANEVWPVDPPEFDHNVVSRHHMLAHYDELEANGGIPF